MNQRTWPRYASIASVVVLCIAASALLGWWTDIALLKSVAPGLVEMKVNTACSLACAAVALQLLGTHADPSPRRAHVGQAFALVPLIVGLLTMLEHLADLDLGIDSVLQQWTVGSGPSAPARMSLVTASCLVCAGAALVTLPYPRLLMLTRGGAAYVLGVSVLAGIGYTFRIVEVYGPGHFQPMALHTTVACVLMSTAILSSPRSLGSRRIRDWPVQTKLVLLLLGASLTPFLLFALVEIRSVALQLLDTQGALLAARADQLADELDDFELDRRHNAAQLAIAAAAIGCCDGLSANSMAQLEKLLQGVQANVSDVVAAALFDAHGKPLQHAGAELPSAQDQPALRAALQGSAQTSELHVARFGAVEEPVLLYAAPVTAATGVQGAAVLWVRAAALWRILTGRNGLAGKDSFAVLFDPLGIRMAHTHDPKLVFRPAGRLRPWDLSHAVETQRFGAGTRMLLDNVYPFPEQLERAVAKVPDGGMFRGFSPAVGAHAYNVGRRLKTLPWTLFYVIPESSLREGLSPHSRNRSLFAVLLGILSLLLGAAAASAILRPLRRLSDATARVGSGRPSAQLQVESRDELGLLAERFNQMLKRIETQASELRHVNEQLELRVAQRTAELSQSEQDLAITLNSIGDAVIATDQHGHVERMNPLAEKLTGWSITEARGTPLDAVFAIFDEETGAPWPSPVARVIRDGVVVNLPNPSVLVSRHGETCPISDSAAPIFTREGRLRGVVLVFRDVREERRAQLALQASESLYRELYENHPDLCATVDLGTECILECNQTLATQLGYTKEELVGKPVRELYAPDAVLLGEADRPIFQRTESLRDQERTLVRKDGSRLETSLSLTGRHDSRGVARAKAVWRDISLRKQVERDQQFLFSLSELQSVATDANDLIVQVCAKLAEYLGAARGCFVEVDDAGDVFHVRRDFHQPGMHSMEGTFSLLAFGELMRNEQRGGKITAVSDARIDPRTAEMYAAWEPFGLKSSLSVPLIRQGRWVVSLIVGHASTHVWQDREIALGRAVAERAWMWIEHARLRTELHERETRELARRNDERFHALVNNVTDYAIYLLDATGHITSWNRGAEHIKGYTEAEVLGKHFSLFFTEEDLERGHADEALQRATTEGHFEEEAWRRRKDGTRFWANVVLTPLYDAHGKVEAFAKVTRDHTERRRTEEALRQRQSQLAASLREREVLLQEVHHRVKNNLQVISSLLSMQMRQVHEDNTRGALEESRRRVEAIALIHEKLYQSVDYSKVQFSEYVSTLAASVFHAAGMSPANIKLKLQVEPVSLAVDKAIPCGLVLNELISNTLKHGFPDHRKGTVKVELRKLEQGKVLLLVADDGVGIPADFDLENSGSLGMQLVTTLVEQVRGELEVVRTPGTTFRIRVPVEMQP